MDLTDFICNGFTQTTDDTVISKIQATLNDWENLDSKGIRYRVPKQFDLQVAHQYIADTYVSKFFDKVELGYNGIWDGGIKRDVDKWHNDLIEGCNLFVMLYLNDVTTGGQLCFKCNDIETGCIQPRKGLLVMGSQELHVVHKVSLTTEQRMVCNFGFNVSWI